MRGIFPLKKVTIQEIQEKLCERCTENQMAIKSSTNLTRLPTSVQGDGPINNVKSGTMR